MAETNATEFYEDYWSRTEQQRMYGPVARHTRRLIRQAIAGLEYRTVLDVGCGEGSLIRDLASRRAGLDITGTDLSPRAIELAARKNPALQFKVLDLAAAPLPQRFDLVVCSEVIEHIPDDGQAVRNLAAMTGHYLVITTLGGRRRRHEENIGHLRNYDPAALAAMVAATGLHVARLIQWGWPFYSPLYRNALERWVGRDRGLGTGAFGWPARAAAAALYALFLLNSARKGDQLVLLAERQSGGDRVAAGPTG